MNSKPQDLTDSLARSLTPDPVEVGMTADDFKAVFRNHAAGVALITADAGDGPVAMTATSVFSVSATPPLLVFSASELSSSTSKLRRAETVVVHLLAADQIDLAVLGSTSGIDRFADTSIWSRLPTGEPYFLNASAWIRGRIVNQLAAGGATVFVILGLEASPPDGLGADGPTRVAQPLVYHNRTWHSLSGGSQLT